MPCAHALCQCTPTSAGHAVPRRRSLTRSLFAPWQEDAHLQVHVDGGGAALVGVVQGALVERVPALWRRLPLALLVQRLRRLWNQSTMIADVARPSKNSASAARWGTRTTSRRDSLSRGRHEPSWSRDLKAGSDGKSEKVLNGMSAGRNRLQWAVTSPRPTPGGACPFRARHASPGPPSAARLGFKTSKTLTSPTPAGSRRCSSFSKRPRCSSSSFGHLFKIGGFANSEALNNLTSAVPGRCMSFSDRPRFSSSSFCRISTITSVSRVSELGHR